MNSIQILEHTSQVARTAQTFTATTALYFRNRCVQAKLTAEVVAWNAIVNVVLGRTTPVALSVALSAAPTDVLEAQDDLAKVKALEIELEGTIAHLQEETSPIVPTTSTNASSTPSEPTAIAIAIATAVPE